MYCITNDYRNRYSFFILLSERSEKGTAQKQSKSQQHVDMDIFFMVVFYGIQDSEKPADVFDTPDGSFPRQRS